MPQPFTSVNQRTAVRQFFQAENGLFECAIPFEGRIGMLGVDFPVQIDKIALSSGSDANEVCHARLRTRRETSLRAESFLFSRPPGLAEYLPRRPPKRQYRE